MPVSLAKATLDPFDYFCRDLVRIAISASITEPVNVHCYAKRIHDILGAARRTSGGLRLINALRLKTLPPGRQIGRSQECCVCLFCCEASHLSCGCWFLQINNVSHSDQPDIGPNFCIAQHKYSAIEALQDTEQRKPQSGFANDHRQKIVLSQAPFQVTAHRKGKTERMGRINPKSPAGF
jgi:hypothetical protein